MLGTVAVLLLNYDISFVRFLDGKGRGLDGGLDAFPKLKDNYAGNQVVGIEGDMRVTIKRRRP